MTKMIRKTISLPQGLADYIHARLQSGLYGNDSEYFRELVRADQRRQDHAAFAAMIEDSLASGVSPHSLEDIFEQARRRAGKRAKTAGQ